MRLFLSMVGAAFILVLMVTMCFDGDKDEPAPQEQAAESAQAPPTTPPPVKKAPDPLPVKKPPIIKPQGHLGKLIKEPVDEPEGDDDKAMEPVAKAPDEAAKVIEPKKTDGDEPDETEHPEKDEPTIAASTSAATGPSIKAPNADGLTLTEIVVARKIEDKTPIGAGIAFPTDVGELWCYTKVDNPKAKTQIVHKWYYKGKMVSNLTLNVGKSPSWRTWSKKRIGKKSTGSWSCTVEDSQGTVLASYGFSIE